MKILCAFLKPFNGKLHVPADKSISHRAIMLSSISPQTTRIENFLEAEDTLNTMRAFKKLGVRIELENTTYLIQPPQTIDTCHRHLNLGNSGTSIRILAGLLCGKNTPATLSGDAHLHKRPMKRIIEPLQKMGANITGEEDKPPLHIQSIPTPLKGIDYTMPVASAQIKSSILMAGLCAQGFTQIHSPGPCRDHTERMLRAFGINLEFNDRLVRMEGRQSLRSPTTIEIPNDLSSAAFFIVAALLQPEAHITLLNVGINPTRIGVLNILERMGACIERTNKRLFGDEPVCDLVVKHSALHGVDIHDTDVTLAIDEIPILMIAASVAKGATTISDAAELRVKESDRLHAMCTGLEKMGVNLTQKEDGVIIQGGTLRAPTTPIDSFGDHRIAMSFAIAASVCQMPVAVKDCENINTSFPTFIALCNELGLNIEIDEA